MATTFTEILLLTPLPGQDTSSPPFTTALSSIMTTLASTPGALTMQIRHSTPTTSPPQFLLLGTWTSKAAFDYLDIEGYVPTLLRTLTTYVSITGASFTYLNYSLIDFTAEEMVIEAMHVKPGKRAEFDEVVREQKRMGAWYVVRGMAPSPRVMPTDEVEVKILEAGRKKQEEDLKGSVPDIWIAVGRDEGEEFRKGVEGLLEKVEGGVWGKFLEGGKGM